MSIDLRMEPYARMFENERPESRIIPELCVPDITDKLCDRLGLSWYEFHAVADEEGRLPHEAALRLLAAVESHHALAEKLLTLLHYYCDWYENPGRVCWQIADFRHKSAIRHTQVI